MRSTKSVSEDIFQIEGFQVRFVGWSGEDVSQRRVDDYPYQRAARNAWNVAQWKRERFEVNYPDFKVEVLDPDGNPVHGRTLLENLRVRYLEAEDATDEREPLTMATDAADGVRDEDLVGLPHGDGSAFRAPAPVPDAARPPGRANPAALAAPAGQPRGGGLTQQELESRLWAAANSLRGPVDPSDFKAYIFPLLFFKRISDAWDEEHAQAIRDFGKDVTDEVEADYHRFQLPNGCHWSDVRKLHENVGIGLQRALDRIQEANPDTLAGIFGDVAWGNKDKLPEPSLLNLIGAFTTLPLGPSKVGHDVLGNAYEYLLRQFADESGKKAGEFFTPRSVVRLLSRILDPQPADSVYDPACGSGGMLIEAANEVIEAGGSVAQMRFYGQEVNLTTAAIARMNLYLHNIEDTKVLRGDTLRDPKFKDERGRLQRYDIVIANPPFSLKNWGADAWVNDPYGRSFCGTPPTGNADFAWVQHMVASMKPGTGRVGVVMPHGVLFRGGAEARIRQCLIEDDQLDAVIGLPPNLFYSTTIPACLLIFRVSKPDVRRQRVVFVDGSKRFTKGRNQNHITQADVEAIVSAYRTLTDPDGQLGVQVRVVDHAEIKDNGWDLNIGRYLKTAAADTPDVATALANLAEAQQALRAAEARLTERLAEAGYA